MDQEISKFIQAGMRIGNFIIDSYIDGGGEATVWKAHSVHIRNYVAIKIKYTIISSDNKRELFNELWRKSQKEAQNWNDFKGNNYVLALNYFFEEEVQSDDGATAHIIAMVMDYSQIGSIDRAIFSESNKIKFSLVEKVSILNRISKGIKCGHDSNIVHGDIKPRNIILFNESDEYIPKVSDFGISTGASQNAYGFTPEYAAPELYNPNAVATLKSDIYSLGILFYEILYEKRGVYISNNIDDSNNLLNDIKLYKNLNLDFIESDDYDHFNKLIKIMTNKNADKRPSINAVISQLRSLKAKIVTLLPNNVENVYVIRRDSYRWNQSVHRIMGHKLYYCFIGIGDDRTGIIDVIDRLKNDGFNGYSAYRVLGGYDLVIRCWIDSSKIEKLRSTLEKFKKEDHNRSYDLFEAINISYSSIEKNINVKSEDDLLDLIINGSNPQDRNKEYNFLKNNGLVTMHLRDRYKNKITGVRFFIRVLFDKVHQGIVSDYVGPKLRKSITEKSLDVCIYTVEGLCNILIKIIVPKYSDFVEVHDSLCQKLDELGHECHATRVAIQTYVELDSEGYRESDDGPLIHKAQIYNDFHS